MALSCHRHAARESHQRTAYRVDKVGGHGGNILAAVHLAGQFVRLRLGDFCLRQLQRGLGLALRALQLFILFGHGIPPKETDIRLHRRAEFKFPALHGVQYAVLGQLLHPSGADSKHGGKLSRGNIFVRNFFSRSHLEINSFPCVQSG